MSATVSGMVPVSLPRFAANGTPATTVQTASAPAQSPAWVGEAGQDGLDFDLLAEYLLDDGTTAGPSPGGMPQFDFSMDSAPASGVVSPEQSDDGMPSIPETAPTPDASVPMAQPLQQPALTNHPTRNPVSTQATNMSHPGLPMPPAPAPFPSLPASVPAPIAAAPPVVVHQHGMMVPTAPHNKRRRVDMPMMAIANSHPGALLNGHLVTHAIQGRGRQKTQAQIDRRRERNRILARRTRLRKKFFFESLQKEVVDLQRENAILKELAKKHLKPEESKELLDGCKAMEQLPSAVQEACGDAAADMDQQDFNLVQSIQRSQQCFVITDPSLQDNPIVYASDAFHTLTGYKREEVLGRNCRFLQGTETSPQKVEQIRKAVLAGQDVTVTLINYTANGTAFWNKLFVAALRDAQNNIVNFIGVIVKVAAPGPDDPEANKRLPGSQHATTGTEEDVQPSDGSAATAKAVEGTVNAIEGVAGAAVAATPVANGTQS